MKPRTLVLTLTTFLIASPMWLLSPDKAEAYKECNIAARRTNGDVRLNGCKGPYGVLGNQSNIVIRNINGKEKMCVITAQRTGGDVRLRCL